MPILYETQLVCSTQTASSLFAHTNSDRTPVYGGLVLWSWFLLVGLPVGASVGFLRAGLVLRLFAVGGWIGGAALHVLLCSLGFRSCCKFATPISIYLWVLLV